MYCTRTCTQYALPYIYFHIILFVYPAIYDVISCLFQSEQVSYKLSGCVPLSTCDAVVHATASPQTGCSRSLRPRLRSHTRCRVPFIQRRDILHVCQLNPTNNRKIHHNRCFVYKNRYDVTLVSFHDNRFSWWGSRQAKSL